MPSKRIKQQAQRLRTVLIAAFQQAPLVAENLAARLLPFLPEGAAMPDFSLLQQMIGHWLDATSLKMADSHDELALGRKELAETLVGERQLVRQLRKELAEVRRFFDEQLGVEVSRGILPERLTSRLDADGAQMVAGHMIQLLRDPQRFSHEKAEASGNRPTAAGLADALERKLAALRPVQAVVEQRRQDLDMRLELRDRELQEAVEAQRRARDLLFGVYRAAGFDHVADRLNVRPRRKSKVEEPPGPPAIGIPVGEVPGQSLAPVSAPALAV